MTPIEAGEDERATVEGSFGLTPEGGVDVEPVPREGGREAEEATWVEVMISFGE